MRTKLVRFRKHYDGRPVWIQPFAVLSVQEGISDGTTNLLLDGEILYTVEGEAADIVERLHQS